MAVWRVRVQDTEGAEHDVHIDAQPASRTADLAAQLKKLGFRAQPVELRGRAITRVETMGELGLRQGDVLDAATPYGRSQSLSPLAQPLGAGLHLVVVAGPRAGLIFPIGSTSATIGRARQAQIKIDDPALSAVHASIRADNDGIQLTDLGSTNGTHVEGQRIPSNEAMFVPNGAYLQIGVSIVTVLRLSEGEAAVVDPDASPTTPFPRRFRGALEPLPPRLSPPREPAASVPTKSSWWRSLTPLIAGVGFAAMTGRWELLLITALAPLLFAADSRRARKTTEADRQAELHRYQTEQAEFRTVVDNLRTLERQRLRHAAIPGGMAAALVQFRHRRLWERSSADPDFGSISLGLANLPSSIEVGDADALTGQPTVWGMPVTASLTELGSVGVIGPPARSRAVLRSILLGLAATHSPADLHIWLFTDQTRADEWAFWHWLPHSERDERTVRSAFTTTERTALLRELADILATRREQAQREQALPLHLIVIDAMVTDGIPTVAPEELARLLKHGRADGVLGLVADAAALPEGVAGLLVLGPSADQATYESTVQPLVKDVLVPEMPRAVARTSALRLAGLGPSDQNGHGRSGSGADSANLVDLLDLGSTDAETFVSRWRSTSPSTAAVVGVASDTPMIIDIARHGPHGLVGGMSGSGKTEFLMTLLSSLCCDNHPDDLGIVIVDFKGGVDHALTSQLPHVVGLSTNLQIEQFARTITLLDAEQQRRQRLFRGVGADLTAYRAARAGRPDLPAVPRLLVIVDEFSELLASDEGRERLEELIRVTRIGRALGVHLLLVTQNFEGQLPPQVEANAGLRVCLRVMKPSHSKVVLGTGLASTIQPTDVGRAYVRFGGGELSEFQTARVAGRRTNLASGPPPLRVTPAGPNGTPMAETPAAVPTEETDMFELIEHLGAAAKLTGWSGSAIPWPGELDSHIPLRSLLAHRTLALEQLTPFPVGVEDCPAEQRQTLVELGANNDHVLLLGGHNQGLTAALQTIALSAALIHSIEALHLHGIDLDGSGLAWLSGLPHVGTIATKDNGLAQRLVNQLANVVGTRRLQQVTRQLAPDSGAPSAGTTLPHQLLLVTGAERLVRRGEDARHPLLAPLIDLMADSHGTGVQVILAGLPALADSRLGSMVDRRFVFGLPGDLRPTSYGVPRELAAALDRPGRAVDSRTKRLVQFAEVGNDTSSGRSVCADLSARFQQCHPLKEAAPLPSRIMNVPWPLPMALVPDREPPAEIARPFPIGVEAETGNVAWIDSDDDGPLLVVAGPAKSGRSNALVALAQLARRAGWWTVAVPGTRRSPLGDTSTFDRVAAPETVSAAVADRTQPVAVFFDDVHRINADALDVAALLNRRALLVVAGPIEWMTGRSPLRKLLPAHQAGILLAPTGPSDGAAIGLAARLSDTERSNPRPGVGLSAIAGESKPVRIPLATTPPAPAA